MTRRVAPQPGVDRMVSKSWSGRRWSSPAARQGRALARGLEGRLPLQHHHQRSKQLEFALSGFFFSCPQTRYLPRPPQVAAFSNITYAMARLWGGPLAGNTTRFVDGGEDGFQACRRWRDRKRRARNARYYCRAPV